MFDSKGELKYRNGLPVLTVEGTPEEIGEQIGVLAIKPGSGLPTYIRELFKARNLDQALPRSVTDNRGVEKTT